MHMTSYITYITRSIYEWIIDNNCTPFLVIDATKKNVDIPNQYVKDGHIIFDISLVATENLAITNEYVSFVGAFNGVKEEIYAPTNAILAIYAKENGEGFLFENGIPTAIANNNQKPKSQLKESNNNKSSQEQDNKMKTKSIKSFKDKKRHSGKPNLRIIK